MLWLGNVAAASVCGEKVRMPRRGRWAMADRIPSMPAPDAGSQSPAPAGTPPRRPSPQFPGGAQEALYEAMQQAAMSEPVVTLARELRARINPAALAAPPEQGSPRTASSQQPLPGEPAGLAAQGFDQGAAPSTSAPPADVDALPTTPSSQALQPRGETP